MTALERARIAWGEGMPDWVQALATEVDRTSQSAAARLLMYTPGVVHGVLRNNYGGSMEAVEERVRMHLLVETVPCPILAEIEKRQCKEWRRLADEETPTSRLQRRMKNACITCPFNQVRDA